MYHDESADLDAVTIDEATGKIAASSSDQIHIYKPYGRQEGVLKWSLESSIPVAGVTNGAVTLSWGSDAELLLGASSLRLYQTNAENGLVWDRKLPKPVRIAEFSHDGSLIASAGQHDRLVKLWRRQTFGADDTRFDFTYLQHPTTVTGVHWQRSHVHKHHIDNVLFTICADSKIRIWAAVDPHCVQALQLWGQIDMQESIQPRLPDTVSKERYAFFIDSTDLAHATEQAMKDASENTERENHALEHLREVAKNSPEICVVLDESSNMSAWGLENIGNQARKPTDIFNVAHVVNFKLPFLRDMRPEENTVQFLTFTTHRPEQPVVLLSHHFDGRILWSEFKLDQLFDPSPNRDRLVSKALWTGHDGSIKKIVRSHSGEALISRTNDNESLIWKQRGTESDLVLTRSSSLNSPTHIHRTLLLREGDFVVCLHHDRISIWDTRTYVAHEASSCEFEVDGKPLCLVQLPNPSSGSQSIYLATVTSKMESIAWVVNLPAETLLEFPLQLTTGASITECCRSIIGTEDELAYVLPVDPAGSMLNPASFLDTFAKDIAISYTYGGTLRAWTAVVDDCGVTMEWLETSRVQTGITNPSLVSATSIRKTALVNALRNRLTIWNQTSGQLEYDVTFEAYETIQDLDWSATPDNQSVLAVGYPYKVVVLAQLRYDYLNAGPAWAPIREIHIKELTPHPIGDSVWLGSGSLAIGAGNQLFVYDEDISTSDNMVINLSIPLHSNHKLSIFDLVTYLNGTLPIFHPQFLTQCILAGKQEQVQQTVLALHKALKFFVVGDLLDSFLSLSAEQFFNEQVHVSSAAKKAAGSSYTDFVDDEEPQTVTEELAISLNEYLAKLALPQLSSRDQIHLAGIIECVATAEKHRRSMDDLAMRFLVIFQQHILRKSQGPAGRVNISWREIVWAFHSGSQDILVDLVSRQFQGRMLWEHARESGMFMWMTDLTALVCLLPTLPKPFPTFSCPTANPLFSALPIRDHSSKRVHQDRRKEPHRLLTLLPRPAQEARPPRPLAHGRLEPRTGGHPAAAEERLQRSALEDGCLEERLRPAQQAPLLVRRCVVPAGGPFAGRHQRLRAPARRSATRCCRCTGLRR